MILILTLLAVFGILTALDLVEDKRTCRKEGSDYILRISEQYIDHSASAADIGNYVLKQINNMEEL